MDPNQVQAAVYFVIGIIVIEGIWLTYLTYMMWKRHRQEKEVPVEVKAESKDTPKQE
jgi:hypothetical protein